MDEGVLYIAVGEDYIEEANKSVEILKNEMPDTHVTLITDEERLAANQFDDIKIIDDSAKNMSNKINHLQRTPYDRTVFFDTDIYVDQDFSELFNLLDEFDIALAHETARFQEMLEDVPRSFSTFNTGVIVYRNNSGFRELLSRWREIYLERAEGREGQMREQPSFRKAIYESDLRVATLTPEYNCRFAKPGFVSNKVRIFHGRLTEVDSEIGDRIKVDAKKAAEKINKSSCMRVFLLRSGSLKILSEKPTYKYRFLRSFKNDGLIPTLGKAIKRLVTLEF